MINYRLQVLPSLMEQGKIESLDDGLSIDAAQYGVDLKHPLADSLIYATAQKINAIVWTHDADFKSAEGVRYYLKSSNT